MNCLLARQRTSIKVRVLILIPKTYLQDHNIGLANILKNEVKIAKKKIFFKLKRGDIFITIMSPGERFIF